MQTVETDRRRHAIIEQVIADLKNGAFAHATHYLESATGGAV
jgi:hypothetical protein